MSKLQNRYIKLNKKKKSHYKDNLLGFDAAFPLTKNIKVIDMCLVNSSLA